MPAQMIVERAQRLASIIDAPKATGEQWLDAVRLIGELRRLVDGLGADLAGQIDRLSGPERDAPLARALGERSAAAVVEIYAGVDAREAHEWVRVGAALQPDVTLQGEVLPLRHEALAAAVHRGRLSVGTAGRVLATLTEIDAFSTHDERVEVEELLVGAAPRLSDRQFAGLCRVIPTRFNPDGVLPREQDVRDLTGVRVRRTRHGLVQWVVTMLPEAEGYLSAATDARTAPRRQVTFSDPREPQASLTTIPDDPRPLAQRRLDALVSIARESLAHDHGRVAGTSVTMAVTVSLDDLRSGLGTAKISGVDEPISAATARRLAADAGIIPVVLGGSSEPLDMGRVVRLATEPQRRALEIRDGGCIWPGCSTPPGWCDVAHVVAWFLGGATDLDNLMLLCPFHHRRFDNDGWNLERRDGERYLIPPPWVDSARTPRLIGPADRPKAA